MRGYGERSVGRRRIFRRLGGCGNRGIADAVSYGRLLPERSELVKNHDPEQSDGGIKRSTEPQTQRYGIFHYVPRVLPSIAKRSLRLNMVVIARPNC